MALRATSEPWQKHELPPPDTARWVSSRKKKILEALAAGNVTREYVIRLYGLTDDELQLWENAYSARGQNGLKVTKIQHHHKTT